MQFILPKYQDIIKMSQELKDAALAPIRAKQAQVRFDAAIAGLQEELINAEAKINELAAKHPLDVDKLVDAVDTRALIERRIKATTEVYDQMFGGA